MPKDPQRRALKQSEADRDAAAEITPDDIARALADAPAPIRPYLDAEPDPREAPEGAAGDAR